MIRSICNVLSAIGWTSIDLFEWQRGDVEMKRLPNNPTWSSYGSKVGTMSLTGIRLAHAVVKADYLRQRNYVLPSLGFLLQMDQIIDFSSSSNLRLLPGASSILSDVTQSSVIGRVGQGLSILFAESRGYDFVGHLASNSSVLAHLSTTKERERVADFLFEKSSSFDRMILESKATLSLHNNECSPVKSVLKKALNEQVDNWMKIITPSPKKGYALYSCLREAGNPTESAIIFVDPPQQKGDFHIELPKGWVRRNNYAAWLRLMGLRDAADRLRAQPEQKVDYAPRPTRFGIVEIDDRKFAVQLSRDRSRHFPHSLFAIGIEVTALRAISAAIGGSADALQVYSGRSVPQIGQPNQLSVLRDGTVFGLIDIRAIKDSADFAL